MFHILSLVCLVWSAVFTNKHLKLSDLIWWIHGETEWHTGWLYFMWLPHFLKFFVTILKWKINICFLLSGIYFVINKWNTCISFLQNKNLKHFQDTYVFKIHILFWRQLNLYIPLYYALIACTIRLNCTILVLASPTSDKGILFQTTSNN